MRSARLQPQGSGAHLLVLNLQDGRRLAWLVNDSVVNDLQLPHNRRAFKELRREAYVRSTAVYLLAQKLGVSLDGANQVVQAAVEERREADREAGRRAGRR